MRNAYDYGFSDFTLAVRAVSIGDAVLKALGGEVTVPNCVSPDGPELGTCVGCEGEFPESALNYSNGDGNCANCFARLTPEQRRPIGA